MAERGVNPGMAASITIVLHAPRAAKSLGHSTVQVSKKKKKKSPGVPYSMINKVITW